MNSEYLKYFYFLNKVKLLGNVRMLTIANSVSTLDKLYSLSLKELINIEGISDKIANEILLSSKNYNKILSEFENLQNICSDNDIKITTIFDSDYPINLKEIYDPPVYIFYKGNLTSDDKNSLGIVGTRTPSEYGKAICSKLTDELVKFGIMIISGMALGIDAISHKKCLQRGVKTYAVLGSGVDVIYPKDNKKLYSEILENGAIISEYEPGTQPDKANFPKRNRIVSGISVGTVIIESGLKGGSLITAEYALDQNRELFAVPGDIRSKQSFGTNELIKKGAAKLVTKAKDILEELESKLQLNVSNNPERIEKNFPFESLNENENLIYNVLSFEPLHIDKINEITGLNISDCLVNLLTLEFKGIIKQLPGKYFIKC